MIIAHVLFMRGYYRSWWDPSFQWHKSTDKLTQTPGFRAVEMAVYYYVQDRDLRNLIVNWKDNDHFAKFLREYPEGGAYTSEKLASEFFNHANKIHTKHFEQWRSRYLHLALAGDSVPARYLANWFLGSPIPSELPISYHSETHRTTIHTNECCQFLIRNNTGWNE